MRLMGRNLLIHLFFTKKARALFLIVLNTWLAGLVFFCLVFLLSLVDNHLMVRHLGAIPSVAVTFEQPVSRAYLNGLVGRMQPAVSPEAVRAGSRVTRPVAIRWKKGDRWVRTRFDMVLTGWDLAFKARLQISDGNRRRWVSCLRMHPASGFYVPADELTTFGDSHLIIELAQIDHYLVYTVPLNLSVALRRSSDRDAVGGVACRRLAIPLPQTPPSAEAEERFARQEKRFYDAVNACLEPCLGRRLTTVMNADLRASLYQLFSGEPVCIPSLQIWEDMCGIGVVDRASFKEIDFPAAEAGAVQTLDSFGFLRTRYRPAVNGYRLYMGREHLDRVSTGRQPEGLTVLELDVPGCTPGSDVYKNLCGILRQTAPDTMRIEPWWELADVRSVDFLLHALSGIKWAGFVILFFCFVALYHLCVRFSSDIHALWMKTAAFFGGRAWMPPAIVAAYSLILAAGSGALLGLVFLGLRSCPYARTLMPAVASGNCYGMVFGTVFSALVLIVCFVFGKQFFGGKGIVLTLLVAGACALASLVWAPAGLPYIHLLFGPLFVFLLLEALVHTAIGRHADGSFQWEQQ